MRSLFLKALSGENIERPPVWMMRQAGRYLPEYQKLRNKYSFFERVQTPELACEITLQPIKRLGVDAAILFSDILVVPQAMGLEVQLIENIGPLLPKPIKTEKDFSRIHVAKAVENLPYVLEAIKLIKEELAASRLPLIGFAGAPWTIFCYMIQGKGSKTFDEAKIFYYQNPILAQRLLQMITDTTIDYLSAQIDAGTDAVQIFDSWGGLLAPDDFEEISLSYIRQILSAIKDKAPIIVFAKGAGQSLKALSNTGARALGIDWMISPQKARAIVGENITLQGNFDPAKLFAPRSIIKKEAESMLKVFGKKNYIANLGHGILPNTPLENAQTFIDTVKEMKY